MKLPKALPATPEERVTMLEAIDRAETQMWDVSSPRARDRTFTTQEEIADLRRGAEDLDLYHRDPLPPGYEVIFMVHESGRTIYGLRLPPGASDEYYVVADTIPLVLADAWTRHYRRMPDGLPDDIAQRMVDDPPMARPLLLRLLWDVALHHTAAQQAAMRSKADDDRRSPSEREAVAQLVLKRQAASTVLSVERIRRLGCRLGVWEDDDLQAALTSYAEDYTMVMPWLALFARYIAPVDPHANRWWCDVSNKAMDVPRSPQEAEKRMVIARDRAWAATYLMAVACAAEMRGHVGPFFNKGLNDTLADCIVATNRLNSLGLLPREGMESDEIMLWARRVLKKHSPRLLAILDRQFKFLASRSAFSPRPPESE